MMKSRLFSEQIYHHPLVSLMQATYLKNEDIIYVNAKGTTRWNRVISQFFPFSTFLNSIDNLVNSE